MSARVSASNLAQAAQELLVDWQQTRSYWRDLKSFEFDQKYLAVLPDHLSKAQSIIGEIDVLLRKVRKDCE